MLKILQSRLQQYMNWELAGVQAGFRKGTGTRDQIANIHWIIGKGNSRKTPTSALLSTLKPLTVWITTNCGKFWKRWEYQTTWPTSWEICMQVRYFGIPYSWRIFQFVWSTQSKPLAQSMKQMFFWNSLAFSMIQWMLAIWSLVPVPFLNPVCTSVSSWFMYCWNLARRILSITLLVCEMSAIVW